MTSRSLNIPQPPTREDAIRLWVRHHDELISYNNRINQHNQSVTLIRQGCDQITDVRTRDVLILMIGMLLPIKQTVDIPNDDEWIDAKLAEMDRDHENMLEPHPNHR